MSENDPHPTTPPPSQPPTQPPSQPPTQPPTGLPPRPPRTRWRDRAYDFRSMLAVGLAGIVVGGIAGVGITLLAADDDHGFDRDRGPGWHHRMHPPGEHGNGNGRRPQG